MAFLREAVEKQKEYLINQLVSEGIITSNKHDLHNKTISEIMNEYDEFLITTEKSTKNSLRFTRSIRMKNKRKPNFN